MKIDIRQFRKALQDLTKQVDELDRIKTDYHRHMAEVERRNHYLILSKTATVVRAQVDIYERISNKGLADPMLEQVKIHSFFVFFFSRLPFGVTFYFATRKKKKRRKLNLIN